jgi:hypothetical protein
MHHHAHVAADILAPLELGDETPRDGLGAGTRAECGYSPEIRGSDAPDRVMRSEQDRTTSHNFFRLFKFFGLF